MQIAHKYMATKKIARASFVIHVILRIVPSLVVKQQSVRIVLSRRVNEQFVRLCKFPHHIIGRIIFAPEILDAITP